MTTTLDATTTDPTITTNGVTLDFNTAEQIIQSALTAVGLDPSAIATTGANVGQTLGGYFWNMLVTQGITDPTTIGELVANQLPTTGQFQVAFPGYAAALKNGKVTNVAQYVTAEEGMTNVMLAGNVPSALITPAYIGDLIARGYSVNQVANRVQNGLDAYQVAPPEVQAIFDKQFSDGPGGYAGVFLNPNIDDVTLQKMLSGAQVGGALAAANLPVSFGLSQRLADTGETFATARQKAAQLTQQAGLFEQTAGEAQSQTPVAGVPNANTPLTAGNQGVRAVFGLDAAAEQQVHQTALAREEEFKSPGGGATQTQSEGYGGLGSAKEF